MVGFTKNGHTHKNLIKNGEPQRFSWEHRRRRRSSQPPVPVLLYCCIDPIHLHYPLCSFASSFSSVAVCFWYPSLTIPDRLIGLVVKAFASRAEDPEFESPLCRNFFWVESYQWLKNWHSSGYPARCLVLWGWYWLAQCQYSVTGWDGTFGLQLLSWCDST